jgi:predicted  nucleic acid-binding Zn-ribbon protein
LIIEQHYLDTLKPYINGLNVSEYADRPPSWLGKKHTEETKKKISEGNKGKICSEYSKQKASETHKGKKLSEEQLEFLKTRFSGEGNNMYGRAVYSVWLEKYGEKVANEKLEKWKNNIRVSNKGRVVSEETRKRISVAKKGKRNSDEAIEKMRQSKLGAKASEETKRKMSEQKRGENNPACKLKDKDVIEILKMLNNGKYPTEISRIYDVSRRTIYNIKDGKRKI